MSITLRPGTTAELHAAMQRVLAAIAFEVEAKAKNAAPVDTGFLRASIQTIAPGQVGVAARAETLRGRFSGGEDRLYSAVATRGAQDNEALVVAHADYAYWVERRKPFLLPAAQAVAADIGAIVSRHRV